MVKLNAGALFVMLLRRLRPQMICDVGSADGQHAERFASFAPWARVVAFEASPVNMEFVQRNAAVRSGRVEAVHTAVADFDGTATFHVPDIPYGTEEVPDRGDPCRQSSIRERLQQRVPMREVTVPCTRLDTFVSQSDTMPESIALWVDVEGVAYEVLEGMASVHDRVQVVHVEVEDEPFWHAQKLRSDVESLLRRQGFRGLARGSSTAQYDLVFVNERTLRAHPVLIRLLVLASAVFSLVQGLGGARFRQLLRKCCRFYKPIG